MGAYTFRRARERLKTKKEQENFTFEELNEKTVPQIKEILDLKAIEYKSNDSKKELIAYLVEALQEDGDDSVDTD